MRFRQAWESPEQVCRRHLSLYHTCAAIPSSPGLSPVYTSVFMLFFYFLCPRFNPTSSMRSPTMVCLVHPTLEQHVEHLQRNRHVGGPPPHIISKIQSKKLLLKKQTQHFIKNFGSFLLLPCAFSPLDEEKKMWLFVEIYFIFGCYSAFRIQIILWIWSLKGVELRLFNMGHVSVNMDAR